MLRIGANPKVCCRILKPRLVDYGDVIIGIPAAAQSRSKAHWAFAATFAAWAWRVPFIASALLAMLLMYVLVAAMAVALMRRMWWRLAARREGADRAAWPFFTHAEARAAARVQDGSPW